MNTLVRTSVLAVAWLMAGQATIVHELELTEVHLSFLNDGRFTIDVMNDQRLQVGVSDGLLRRLSLHRHTQHELGQHSDDGDEPGGVRHAGVSAQADVMSDPILPLVQSEFNALSTHRRKVRLVIRVDDGLGCRLPVSRAHPVASDKDSQQPEHCGGNFGGNYSDVKHEVVNRKRLTSTVRLPPPPPS